MKQIYNYRLWLIALLWVLGTCLSATGQVVTSGRDFWFALCKNYDTNNGPIGQRVYISTSAQAATGVVEVPGCSFNQAFNCPPNSVVFVQLPQCAEPQGSGTVENKGIHVTSDNPVSVYCLNAQSYTTDGALIMPTNTLGYDYYVMAYKNQTGYSDNSVFTVCAVYNNTQVEITPKVNTIDGWTQGVPRLVTLNQGQILQVQAGGDLTGTRVRVLGQGCIYPIALFGGNVCTNIGTCTACDHVYEMMFPTTSLGMQYVYVPTRSTGSTNNSQSDLFRVLSHQNGTVFTVDGVAQSPLNAGDFLQFDAGSYMGRSSLLITSNNPASVCSYGKGQDCGRTVGDPMMMMITPSDVMDVTAVGMATIGIMPVEQHWVSIVTETSNTGNISINPPAIQCEAWSPVTGMPTLSTRRCQIPIGSFRVTSSGAGFNLYQYGWGGYDSYGLSGAGILNQNIINLQGTVTYPDSLCANSPKLFTAQLNGGQATQLTWDWGDGSPVETGPANTHLQRTHTYTVCGQYRIAVQYITQNGTLCAIRMANVWATPNATINAQPANVCQGQTSTITIDVTGTCNGQRPWDIPFNRNPNQVPFRIYFSRNGVAQTPITVNGDGPTTFNTGPVTQSITYRLDSIVNNYAPWTGTRCKRTFTNESVTITPVPPPTITINPAAPSRCAGGPATTLTGQGGVTYSWMPGNLPNTSITVAPNSTTTYTLIGTDANGCSNSTTVTVTVNQRPTVTASANPPQVCQGQSSTLTGSGASTYVWNPGGLTGTSITVTPVGTTTYSVTGTDANGCSNSTTVTVTVASNPPPTVTPQTATYCVGQSPSAHTANSPNGGTYRWYDAQTGGNLLFTGATYNVPTGTAGTYTYYVENVAPNGCVSPRVSATITVQTLSAPTAFPVNAVCPGETVDLFATGPRPSGYNWYTVPNGGTPINPNPLNQNEAFTSPPITQDPTVFYLEYTQNGCISPRTAVTINLTPNPGTPTGIIAPNPACPDDIVTLTVTGPSNPPNVVFAWYTVPNGGTPFRQNLSVNGTATRILPNTPGTYTYYLEGRLGNCISPRTPVTVVVAPPTVPGEVTGGITVCDGGSALLTLSGHSGEVLNWESADDETFTSGVQNITHTLTTYDTGPISQSRCYRAWVGPCPPQPSLHTCITVTGNQVQPGGVTPIQTVLCQGSNQQLRLVGANGIIVRWESYTDCQNYTNPTIINSQSPIITVTNLQTTTCYRAFVESNGCPAAPSLPGNITIDPRVIRGQITPNPLSICSGDDPGTLTLSGHTGNVVRWERGLDCVFSGNSLTTISNTTTTLSPGVLTRTTCWRVQIGSGVCPTAYSDTARINVSPPTVAGTISANQTICSGQTFANLTLTGHTGFIQHWRSSVDNFASFTTIANTTTTLTGTSLITTTCYRAVVKSGACPEASTNTICITVDPPTVAGTLSQSDTVCAGQNSGALSLTGQVGNIVRWESSTNCPSFTSPTTINNTTPFFTSGPLSQTTCYRVRVKSGVCNEEISNIITINVDPATVAGTVTASQTLCQGQASAPLNLSGHTGQILHWERSTDNFGNDITTINNTTASHSPGTLTQNTCFRAVIKSGVCEVRESTPACISFDLPSVGGDLQNNTTVCFGDQMPQLFLTGHRSTIVRWESSTNNFTAVTTISNTTASYTPNALTQTTCFRVQVRNGACPPVYSDTVCVEVTPVTLAGTLGSAQTVCSGDVPATLNLTGHRGQIVRWEFQTTPPQWLELAGETGTSYTPPSLTANHCYRVAVKNGVCPEIISNQVCITVQPTVNGGQIASDHTVCRGDSSNVLILNGHGGNILRWQSSTDDFQNNIVNVTNTTTTLRLANMQTNVCLRAVIQGSGQCPEVYSRPACIVVSTPPVGGTLSGGATVCSGTNSTTLTLTGQVGNIVRYEYSVDTFRVTANPIFEQNNSLIITDLTENRCYRAIISSDFCPDAVSTVQCISVDQPPVGGFVNQVQTVCTGGVPVTLSLTGQGGDVVRWESSTDCVGFTNAVNLGNAGSTSYSPGSLNQVTCFRAIVQRGVCTSVPSGSVRIDVDELSQSGTLSNNQTICSGQTASRLNLNNLMGQVVRWEESLDNTNFNPINNQTTSHDPGVLTATHYYRVVVQNGVCPAVTSNVVTIAVDLISQGGTLSSAATVCATGNGGTLSLTGERGNNYRWEQSLDCPNFSNPTPTGGNGAQLSYQNLAQTTCFRAYVSNGVCPEAPSNVVTITVVQPSQGGQVSPDRTVCLNDASGPLTLTGHTGTVVRWEWSENQDFNPIVGNSVTNVTTYNMPSMTTTMYLRAITQSAPCPETASNAARVEVIQTPDAGEVRSSQTICSGDAPAVLTYFSPNQGQVTVDHWERYENGTWVDIGNGGQTTFQEVGLTANRDYRVMVRPTGGNVQCPIIASRTARITVDARSVAGTLSSPATLCVQPNATGTLTITGNTGNVVGWESSTDNFSSSTPIANITTTHTYTGLTQTTFFRAIVRNGVCPAETTNVVRIQVDPMPTVSNAGTNQTVCVNPGTATLSGNNPTSGTGIWTQVSGPSMATIANASLFNTNLSNLQVGTYVFRWTIGSGVCPSSQSDVRIQVDAAPTVSNAGADQRICISANSINLTGNNPTIGTGTWTKESGPTGGTISNINSASTTVTGIEAGTYVFRWTIRNGVCPDSQDEVTVIVDGIPTVPLAGADQVICSNPGSTNLSGNVISVGSGLWSQVSGPNTATFTASNPTSAVSGMIAGIYVFRWTSSNGVCPPQSDDVSITVDQDPSAPNAGVDQTICQSTGQTVLAGSTPVPVSATGQWTIVSSPNGSSPVVVNPALGTSSLTGLSVAGQYTLRWTVRNGTVCASKSDDVVISVDPTTVSGVLGTSGTVCQNDNRTLTLTGQTGNVVRWEQNVNGGGWVQIGGATGTTYNIVGIQTTTSYRVVVRSGVCPEATTAAVTVTVDPTTVGGNVTTDATVCRDGNSGLVRLSGHVGTVQRWEISTDCATYTSLSNTSAVQTYVNLTQTTCYRAVVKSGVCLEQTSTPARITVVKPAVTGNHTDIRCFGETNGTITITPSGGFPFQVGQPYRYVWTKNGASFSTQQNLTNLGAGRYCVTVTDGINCPVSSCFTVTEPTLLTSSLVSLTNVSCNNANDGTINLNVSGGTPAYTFAWTRNGAAFGTSVEDLSGLNPGTYAVTITDANGCLNNLGPFTITQPSAIVSTTSYIRNVSCKGMSNGSIGHHVTGGTPPYTYLWSPGGMVTEDVERLVAGMYTVTITDATGCQLVKNFNVTEPFLLEIRNVQVMNTRCNGGSDGSIRLDVMGGTAPYFYMWSNGVQTEDLMNAPAGVYDLYVRDANGCVITQSFTIGTPELLTATISELRPVLCAQSSTGALRVNASGGVPPYSYLWNTGSTTDSTVSASAGGYSVSVRDSRGCLVVATYELKSPASLKVIDLQVTNVKCHGGNDGGLAIRVEGGDAHYTFIWSDGARVEDRTDLRGGNYTLTVTDGNGCTLVQTFTVPEPEEALRIVTNKVSEVSCSGVKDGSIDISVRGGVAPYNYLWSNGSKTEDLTGVGSGEYLLEIVDAWGCIVRQPYTLADVEPLVFAVNFVKEPTCFGRTDGAIGIQVSGGQQPYRYQWSSGQTSEDIENVGSGEYLITVTDARGCSKTLKHTLTAPPALKISVVRQTNPTCFGSSNGSIFVQVNGGAGNYTYSWSDGSVNQNLQNVPSGTYILVVRDGSGCSAEATYTLTSPSELKINTAIERSISCSGGNDGTLAIGVAGGVGPYQVEWRRGNTIIGNSLLITGLSAGNYAVKVSDNQGCFTEKAYSLTAPSALSLTVTGSSLNCTNSVDGTVSSSVSGGTPPYSYVWNTGTTASGLTNVGAGIYSLTVTDAKGCRITGSAEVLAPAGIVLKLVNKTHVTCKGLSDGTIEVIAEGGTGKLSYVWNVGFGGNMRSDLQAGVYSVTATDANGCTAVLKDILITQPANALTAKFTYIKESACGGVASGSIGLDVTGGVPPYVYAWSHGSGLEDPADLAPGIYTVTITDMNGCVKVMEAEVKGATEALRVESLLIRPVTCNGGTDGGISLDIRGGTQPYTYRWTNGSTVEDQPNLKAGVYRLEVRDAKNCLLVRSYEVTEALPLSIQADEIVASGCIGSGSVRVSVSGGQEPYTYRWNTGSEDRDLSGAVAGTYQLAVTDGLGCVRVLSVTIPALPTMTATIAIVRKETCFGTNDGVLDLRVNGGTAPYTYLWSNGSTTEDIANAGNGVHSVAITDATGCVIQATVDIPTAGRLTVSLGVKTDIRCNGMRNGLIGINITGGEKPYTYRWSNGSTQEDLTDLGSGIYSVTVRDARGCEATGRYEITEPTVLVVSESGVTPETCAGSKDGTLGVSVTGGVTPYNYVWNTGSREPMLTGIGGGSYTVTVSDANGCRVIKTMVLTSPQAMTVSTVSVKGANCNGGTNGSADVRINGGTQPYSFLWSNLRTMEDLVGVPAGVYTLTVTDANNCRAIHTLTVPTLELSNVKIVGLPSEVCSGGNAVTLTGSPAGGKFSGTGVTGNVFDPKDLTAGDYEVVYSGSLNGCLYRTTATVRVNARPVVTSIKIGNGLTSFCRTDQLNYVLSVVPTESGTTYVYSGRGVVNGRFNPSQAGSGVHSLTVVARNKKGCETRFSQNITVSDPAITNVIASEGTICSGGMSVLRASGAESYVWSPATGLNGTTGETVEARPTRTTTYTVTGITGGCRTSATVRVVVGTSVTVVISQNPTGSVCPGVPVTLRAVSPAVSYEWSPATGLNTNVGSIVVAQLNETTTYTVVATSATGCTSSAQVTVSVQASRVSATADAVDLCSGTGTTLRATGGSGSYLWMPGNMTGAIVPVNPTVTTTYTVRDVNGSNCDQAIVRINVNPTVSGGIGGLQDRYCLNSSPVVPMLLPQGGVLTVNGKVSQVFNPAQVGIGDHELIYRGTNGTCEYRFVRVVSVGETGSAQLLNVKDEYCVIGMPEVMQALPEGGVFTVNGQVTNVIDPRSLGLGTHEVRYSGTESNGCRYESVKLIQVKGSSVQWLNMPTELCLNAPPVVMNAMPNGGTWRVNGVMVSSFDPSRWGAGTHEVTYSGTDGPCTYSRTAIVRVTGGLVMNVTSTNPTSQSTADGSITIQVSGGNGVYSYSITGGQFFVNTNVFSGLSTGTYNIVVRDGAGCTANQTLVLTAPICGVASGLRVVPSVQHADVSWNGVNGAIGYTISWRKVGFNEPWRSTNVNGNSFRIVNLLPGVTYEVRIRTRCGAGLSEFTEIVRFTQLTARDELTAVETELGISVYPNPTKGEFRVDLSESVNGTAVLYDALGREVSREIVSGTAVVFHIDHLSSGIYTLKLTVGNTVKTIKVVRE